MPPTTKSYASIIAAKQRDTAREHAVETLREGTTLSMSLADFVGAIRDVRAIKEAFDVVTLADVFVGVVAPGKPVVGRRRKVRKFAGGRRTKAAKRTAPKRVAPRKAAATKRSPSDTVAKRLNAIVAVLERNGDWMKTSDIHAAVSRSKALFAGVETLLISQYLAKLVAEKSARVKKKGQRGASRYRAAAAAKKRTKKAGSKKAKKKTKAKKTTKAKKKTKAKKTTKATKKTRAKKKVRRSGRPRATKRRAG